MDTLKDTLASVNDWLKFAEAKNAVVVATAAVAMWTSVRLILSNDTGFYVETYLTMLTIFILAGFITSLLSFLPILNYRWIAPTPSYIANRNILYFGYLSTLSKKQLLDSYRHATQSKETDVKEIHGMYAEQIIINSRIALAKYVMFECAVKLLLFGILTPVFALPLLYLSNTRRRETDGIR